MQAALRWESASMIGSDEGEKFALGTSEEQRPWQAVYREMIEAATGDAAGSEGIVGHRYVGRSLPRNDVLYKVRGKARYAANISLPNMLHGCFVRSPYPYAKIKRVDVAKARALQGVQCVLTAGEIPEDRLYVGSLTYDTPILAKTIVRYVGEPVVAIAAESLSIALAASQLVEVDYEPMVPIATPEEALHPHAPKLHPDGNVTADLQAQSGNVEAALASADLVVEGTYENAPIEHCYLEAQAGVSFFDDNVLTLLVCTQYPHFHHKQICRITGLPQEKVRVVQTVIGGAFGGKIDVTIECAASLMTLKTGRPVKMVLQNEEVFTATTKRHVMKIHHRLGAMKDGRIVALDMDVLCDGGAYASYSLIVAGRCVIHAALPYDIPNVRAHIKTMFTNNVTAGAMRSFGVVKLAFATESQINKAASILGISPIEIRRKNAVVSGTKTITGQILHGVGFKKTLDAIEPIYEDRRRAIAKGETASGRRQGLGVACLGYGIGYSGTRNPSTARLEVDLRGKVIANCGTPDIGTGSDMALAQIAAEAAGVDIGRIQVVSGDSTKTDDSGPTSASRTTYFSGNAARLAGIEFRKQFTALAAEALQVPADRVELRDDHLIVNNKHMTFEETCRLIGPELRRIKAYGVFDPVAELDLKTFKGDTYPTYTFATHLAEVEVDRETGRVDTLGYWAAHDAGRIINPRAAEGQIEGGIVMGLGMALWEKLVRTGGYIQNPSMRDYLLPGIKDAPPKIRTIFVDNDDETGPFGAKGVAEASLIPVPAAVAAALYEAVGIRPYKLPMDSETVFNMMQAAGDAGE
jgi:CO/xanthine dehydrogenase Mo-binding subunit